LDKGDQTVVQYSSSGRVCNNSSSDKDKRETNSDNIKLQPHLSNMFLFCITV